MKRIRFGLGAIKNVGANAVESIVAARTEGGRFTSLYDFCERVDLSAVNRRMIESFIKAGALDSLGGARAQLFAVIDGAMEIGTRAWKDRASGQSGLFADLAAHEPAAAHPLPAVPDWTPQEKLTGEKEMLGFYITGHPLDQYMDKVGGARHAFHLGPGRAGEEHRSRAVRHPHRHPAQAQQGRQTLGRLQIEDQEGSVEAMVFSTQYERLLPVLNEDQGRAGPRAGAAGGKRSAQDFRAGHHPARKCPRESAVAHLHPRSR